MLPASNFNNMSTHRTIRLGVAVVSAVALVAAGANPVAAVDPDPVRTLVGLTAPFGIAVHPVDGSVYVAHGGGVDASVLVYERGATTPNAARTLHGVADATNVAIQPGTGDVYVAEYFPSVIHVFDAGSTTPNPAKTRTVANPWDMEFDADGTLYVTSFLADRLLLFSHGAMTPTREVVTPGQPMGVAVHPVTGDAYVGHGPLGVTVLTAGALTPDPTRTLTGAGTGTFLAVDGASGRIYVSDDATVHVYEAGAQTPIAGGDLIGATAARGVATDPFTGTVYVADMTGNRVLVYPAAAVTAPRIAAVAPNRGPTSGGTAVTITGTNLGAMTAAAFGGVAATEVRASSSTRVTAVAPPHAVGSVDVSVSGPSGTVRLPAAFEYIPVAPGKATHVVGSAGNGQVTVSWTPPADTGGVPIASYTVTPTPAGPACATTATSCTIAGLTNGTTYTFGVRTTNTANLFTDSNASAEVKPYIPITQKVKAKMASSKLRRKGVTTVVTWVKRPAYSARDMTARCTAAGSERSTNQLCRVYSYTSGKVKIRTKGYRNVQVTITLRAIPKAGAPAQYGPSETWTRTWRVR
jgi:hypothetical protein